ncbi:MAG: hypothetical protein Kilf2KO_16900 [Rhodospirillales bacterium]
MLWRAAQPLLRWSGADLLVRTWLDGGLEIASRRGEELLLVSLIQLDGDVVTKVALRGAEEPSLCAQHFVKIDVAVGRLTRSLDRARASLLGGLAALLTLANLLGWLASDAQERYLALLQLPPLIVLLIFPGLRRRLLAATLGRLLRGLLRRAAVERLL